MIKSMLTGVKRFNNKPLHASDSVDETSTPFFKPFIHDIIEKCTECGACKTACSFLAEYGTPKKILEAADFSYLTTLSLSYECSLCGLCSEVCPEHLDPGALFLNARRAYVLSGHFNASKYKRILNYEALGGSALFSLMRIPEKCDAVFFPGCTLSGTRPEMTMHMFNDIKKQAPSLGIVLDCCSKPSHDLGLQNRFSSSFNGLLKKLIRSGVKNVITGCANCHKIFREYGCDVTVTSVFEHLEPYMDMTDIGRGVEISIHDPCAMRYEINAHQAVRQLLTKKGYRISEMRHRGKRTVCCGEGGTVSAIRPDFADAWTALRTKEAAGRPVAAYCAGCAGFLNRSVPAYHVADLIYRPEVMKNGNKAAARAPFTYMNRLLLKRRFRRMVPSHLKRGA